MFIVKCLPIVGTAINGVEAVVALVEGDGKKCVAKLAQAGVGAAMDTAFVMSGGLSSLVTAPLTGGTIEGGKIVGKKLISEMVVKEAGKFTTNVAVRAATQYATEKAYKKSGRQHSSSGCSNGGGSSGRSGGRTGRTYTTAFNQLVTGTGRGNEPPKKNPKLPKEHYDSGDFYNCFADDGRSSKLIISILFLNILEPEWSIMNPITDVLLGRNGRVEKLEATIRKYHLKPKGQRRHSITARVRRFVESLGLVRSDIKYEKDETQIRENDEIGHAVGDALSGPNDCTYNFFPQSPNCNMQYYHKVEKAIYNYLEAHDHDDYVILRLELVYVDYMKGLSPDRPRTIKVQIVYSNGKKSTFELSNL